MWKAKYCIGPGEGMGDLHAFEASTISEVKQWARNLERVEGIKNTIFGADFRIDREDFKQWGTNYHWLSVEQV